MPTKQDIQRLREGTPDEVIFNYLRNQDAGFKTAVNRVQAQNPSMGVLENAQFPTAMIDIYYGIKPKQSDPLTTQMASATALPQKPEITDDTSFAGDVVRNIPQSAARFAGDIFNAVTHPFKTTETLAKTIIGGGANAVETIAKLAGVQKPEEIFNLESEKIASAVGDFFAQRYGSTDAIKETIKTDPVRFAADLAGLLSLTGGALRGAGFVAKGAGKIGKAGALARTGEIAGKVSGIVDPITGVSKVIATPFKLLSKTITKLNNANIKSAFNLTPRQIQKITKMGIKPSDFLASQRVVGNTVDDILRQLEIIHNQSYRNLRTALQTIDDTFAVSNVEDLSKILKQLTEDFNQPGLRQIRDEAIQLAKKESMTLSEFTKAKELIDDADFIYRQSGEIKAGLRAKGTGNVRRALRKFIEDKAGEYGVTNVQEINRTTQISKGLLDEISRAAGKGERFLSLRDAIYGGTAGIVMGPIGGLLTIIGERLAATPAIATRLNLILNSLSPSQWRIVQTAIKTGELTNDTRRILQSIIQALPTSEITQAPQSEATTQSQQ